MKNIKLNKVYNGSIIDETRDAYIIFVNNEFTGEVFKREFKYTTVNIGDIVEVVVGIDKSTGQYYTSHIRARRIQALKELENAFHNQTILEGIIQYCDKDNLYIDYHGYYLEIPSSEQNLDIRKRKYIKGRHIQFLVINFSVESPKRVDISNRWIQYREITEELEAAQKESTPQAGIIDQISEEDNGIYINYKGMDVFLPNEELGNNSQVKKGEYISFLIKKTNKRNCQVIVSQKLLEAKERGLKLDQLFVKKQERSIIRSCVKSITEKGLIVECDDYEILIPMNQIDLSSEVTLDKYKNCFVDFRILSISRKTGEVIGSIKDILLDPIRDKLEEFKEGTILEVSIEDVDQNNNEFSVIIKFGENLIGIVSDEEIPRKWKENSSRYLVKGRNVYVAILGLDFDKARLILSIKKGIEGKFIIEAEKAQQFLNEQQNPKGRIFDAIIKEINNNFVTIEVDKYTGYIDRNDLSENRNRHPDDIVFRGEERLVVFKELKDGKLYFSIKELEGDCYDPSLYDASLEELLGNLEIYNNRFIAEIKIITKRTTETKVIEEQPAGILIIAKHLYAIQDGGKLLADPYTGANITVIQNNEDKAIVENGKFYEIQLTLASKGIRQKKKNPYIFYFTVISDEVENPYYKAVKRNFYKFKEPKTNMSLAGMLNEVGMNMYSSKNRMFFELLQNADDASAKNNVRMKIQVLKNYLIIVHDGHSFDRNDFEAITSAANSAKRRNSQKTGYKGIGFKSVFTNSIKVYIKTGGFNFVFDKKNPDFSDFDTFYSKVNRFNSEEEKQEFFEENQLEKDNFNPDKNIPWHLLPFWYTEIPPELTESIFASPFENVAIALNMEDASTEEYKNIILNILNEPRFMLFLRNTRRIQYIDGDRTISISKVKNKGIATLKNSFSEEDKTIKFSVDDEIGIIDIREETLINENVPFHKKRIDDRRIVFVQETEKGIKELDSIPERIAERDETTISLAVPMKEGLYSCADKKRNSLYAFLPMNEGRFHFPFYVNADFVLSSDREGVKDENLWNQFLFGKLGSIIPRWIGKIAQKYQKNYLNLLISELFDEQKEDMANLAKAFNKGYLKALSSTPFIINDKGVIVKQSEIVVDHSGLSTIIGEDSYCELIKTPKRLPIDTCDSSILNYNIFTEIEHKYTSDILSALLNKDNLKYIRHWMKNIADKTMRARVILWLVSKYKENNNSRAKDAIQMLPIFRVGSHYQSIEEIKKRPTHVIVNDNFSAIKDILNTLNFCLSETVSKHPIYKIILENGWLEGYDKCIFNLLQKRTASIPLSSKDKLVLFNHFSSSQIRSTLEITPKELKSWPLFCNARGIVTSLDHLIYIDNDIDDGILDNFKISESDYSEAVSEYLVPGKFYYRDIISPNWSMLTTVVGGNEKKAKTLYKLTTQFYLQAETESVSVSPFVNNNGNYSQSIVFNGSGFIEPKDCLCCNDISIDNKVKAVIDKVIHEYIPSSEIIGFILQKPFSVKKQKVLNVAIDENAKLSKDEIKIFLNYCRTKEENIFKKYHITKTTTEEYQIKTLSKEKHVAYTSDLETLALSREYAPHLFIIPEELCEYANMDGVLTGDLLKVSILESVKSICLSDASFINIESDNSFKLIKLLKGINENNASLFTYLRSITHFQNQDGTKTRISDVTLLQNIELKGQIYPLSELLPSDNAVVQSLNLLIERLRNNGIPQNVLTNLFNLTIPDNFAENIFSDLNNKTVLLNGVQLAYILEYSKQNNIKQENIYSLVENRLNAKVSPFRITWFREALSFIDPSYIIPDKYSRVKDYLSEDYKLHTFSIKKDIQDYNVLKLELTVKEKEDLLNYLNSKWKESKTILSENNLNLVCSRLGIDRFNMFLADSCILESEKLPAYIHNWIESEINGQEERKEFIVEFLQIKDDSCPSIIARKYLEGIVSVLPVEGTNEGGVSQKITLWIEANKIGLRKEQFELLSKYVNTDFYSDEIDTNKLAEEMMFKTPEFSTSRFGYYTYNGPMPHIVILTRQNNYVCYRYNSGDIALIPGKIIINEAEYDKLEGLLLKEILSKYPSQYNELDYIEYRSEINQQGVTGGVSEDEGLDTQGQISINEAAQEVVKMWLLEHGYEMTISWDGYSTINGVTKNGKEYPIVVKSYKSNKYKFSLSPNQWMQLMKENATLLLVDGNKEVLYTTREELLRGKDRITLSFDIENLDHEDRIGALSRTLSEMYFKKIYFDFEKLKKTQYHLAEDLESHGFFNSDSNIEISSGEDEDWQ